MKNKTIFKKWPSSGRLDPAWAQLAKNLPETNVNCHLPTANCKGSICGDGQVFFSFIFFSAIFARGFFLKLF